MSSASAKKDAKGKRKDTPAEEGKETTDKQPDKQPAKAAAPAGDGFDSIFGVAVQAAAPQPKKRVKTGGFNGDSNTSSCILRGIVLGVKKESFQGANGPVPKMRVYIGVHEVSGNGDMSVIQTNVPCFDYVLPTQKLDLPQQSEKKDDKFMAKPKILVVEKDTKARWIGLVAPSFYMKGQKGEETGVEKCKPGCIVEVRGVNCAFGNGKNSDKIYVNANKITCLNDKPLEQWEMPGAFMTAALSMNIMKWSAFAWSMAMNGFEGIHFDEAPELEEQADACRALWSAAQTMTADRVENMANSQTGVLAETLQGHSVRIRETSMGTLVQGGRFFLEENYDSFFAPIVQTGLSPFNRMPTPMQKIRTGDSKNCEDLPDYFMTATVANVTFSPEGKRVDIEFKLQWIFDKTKALAQKRDNEKTPILHTGAVGGAATQIMMAEFAHCMGTMHKVKAAWLAQQIIPVAEMVVWARVFSKNPYEAGLTSEWPQMWTIDVPKTLSNGILVSEAFVKKHLCGGNTMYVQDALKAEDKFDMPKDTNDMPIFEEARYQELTYVGWKFPNLKVPKSYKREFRVFYDGAVTALSNPEHGPPLTQDATKGEEHLETIGHAIVKEDEEFDMNSFLSQKCVVYAVLVEIGLE
ncbi:MAG: hypothetical protein ACKVI4_15135 [Actinomycetales bacterium]